MPDQNSNANVAPWDYATLLNYYKQQVATDPKYKDMSLPDFSKQWNERTQSHFADAGLHDNIVKRISNAVDSGVNATGLPELSGNIFGSIVKGVGGSDETAQAANRIGQGLPRGAADTIAALGGGALAVTNPELSIPAALASAAGYADTAASAYTSSDSIAAGLIAPLATRLLPGSAGLGSRLVAPLAEKLGGKVVEDTLGGTPTQLARSAEGRAFVENALDKFGGQLGVLANVEAAKQATSLASGQGFSNPFTTEHGLELAANFLPAATMEGVGLLRTPINGVERSQAEGQRIRNEAQVENTVQQNQDVASYVKTKQQGTPPAQGDNFAPQLDEDMAHYQQQMNSYSRLMGDPIVGKGFTMKSGTEIPSLSRPTEPVPITDPARLLEDAQKVVQGPITSPDQVKVLGSLIDQTHEALGEIQPPITDAHIAAKIDDGLSQGMSPTVATEMAVESLRNKLDVKAGQLASKSLDDMFAAGWGKARDNGSVRPVGQEVTKAQLEAEVAKEPTKAEQSTQSAIEQFGNLPEEVQSKVGDVMTKQLKEYSSEADTDLSDRVYSATAKFASDPENQKALLSTDSKIVEKSQKQLARILGGVKKNVDDNRNDASRSENLTKATGKAKSIYVEDKVGELIPEIKDMTPVGQQTVSDMADHEIRQMSLEEKLNAPITVDEAKVAFPKAKVDEGYVARLNEIISQLKAREISPDLSDPKNPILRYTNIDGLRKVFPGVTDKTIRDFVKDNYKKLGTIFQQRGVNYLTFGTKEGVTPKFNVSGSEKQAYQLGKDKAFVAQSLPFFQLHFQNRGYSLEQAGRLAKSAQRIAAIYREISPTRITELVHEGVRKQDTPQGVYLHYGDVRNGAIGLHLGQLLYGTKGQNTAFETFAVLNNLGHEAFHPKYQMFLDGKLDPRQMQVMNNVVSLASSMSKEEMDFTLRSLFNLVIPKEYFGNQAVRNHVNGLIEYGSTNGVEEYLASYSGLITLGAANPVKFNGGLRDYLTFGDKRLTDFSLGQYLDAVNMTDAVGDYLKLENAGGYKKEIGQLAQLGNSFRDLLSTQKEIDSAIESLRNLDNVMEGGLPALLEQSALDPIITSEITQPSEPKVAKFVQVGLKNVFGDDKDGMVAGNTFLSMLGLGRPTKQDTLFGIEPSKLDMLLPAAQFAARYPTSRPVIDLALAHKGIANKFKTLALAAFMTLDKYDKMVLDPTHSGLDRALNHAPLNAALNELFLEQNYRYAHPKEGVDPAMSDAEIESFAKKHGLSANDTGIHLQVAKNFWDAMYKVGNAKINSTQDLIGRLSARVLMNKDKTRDAKSAYAMGQRLVSSLLAASSDDPNSVLQGKQGLEELQNLIVNPEHFQSMVDAVDAVLPQFGKSVSNILAQPRFMSETRLGKFHIRFVEDGEDATPHYEGYDTREELQKRMSEVQKMSGVDQSSIQVYDKTSDANRFSGASSDALDNFIETERAVLERWKAEFPEDSDILSKLSETLGDASMKELAAKGIGKYDQQRKLIAGREKINMVQGGLEYIQAVSSGIAKKYTGDLGALYLKDPSLQSSPKMQKLLGDYLNRVVSPPTTSKMLSNLRGLVFQMTLGGNLSSLLVERMQPIFSLAPHLTQSGATIPEGYKLMGRAMSLLSQVAKGGKIDSSLPIRDVLKRATLENHIDFGIYQELANQDLEIINLRNLATGQSKIQTLNSLAMKPLKAYTNFTKNIYTKSSSQNNRIAFLSSYLLAMEKGVNGKKVSPEDAYQFAVQSVHTSMFGGGEAAKPIGLFNNLGKAHSAVSALYILQHYTTSSIAMMYRLMMDAKTDTASKKALGQWVMTQTLMAGTLGLPLVGGTLSLLEQMFPNLEAKKKIRETLAGLAGDDKEMGELISDSVLHGAIPRILSLGTVDLSGRFGLGNIYGIDQDYGFRWENVFGAPGSVIANMLGGISKATTGQVGQGLEQAVPTAWKNIIKSYNDDFAVRDKNGNLLMQPTEAEKIMTLVGIRPKRVSEMREEQQIMQRSDQIQSQKMQDFHQNLADLLTSGDTQQVKALLLQKHQEDPTYNPQAGLSTVVQIAQNRVTPSDVLGSGSRGNSANREAIAQTFMQTPRVSEVQNLLARKQMEASVGLAGSGGLNRQEMSMAQMVDALRNQNPTLTLAHARAIVERQVVHSRAVQ